MAVISIKRTTEPATIEIPSKEESSCEAVPAVIFTVAVEADVEAEELVVAVSVSVLRVVSVDIRLLLPV